MATKAVKKAVKKADKASSAVRAKAPAAAVKPVAEPADGMNERHRAFCEEYLVDLNATRAYRAVYPEAQSYGGASASASALLRNPKVSAYIGSALAALRSERIMVASEVLEQLSAIARGTSEAEVVVVLGTGEGCSQEKLVMKRPDHPSQTKALELLGRRYGLFTDKVDHTSGGESLGPMIFLPSNGKHSAGMEPVK